MNRNRNWTYLTVSVITRLYMVGALAISFGHIVTTANLLQLGGWQAYTVPLAIDGFAVLGMIGRWPQFAPSTRRTGLRLQAVAGLLSLACNIYAGATIGERLYGALIVIAFVTAEWYADKLAPAPTARRLDPAEARRRADKAATTRKANQYATLTPAQKAAATRKRNRELAAMVDGYVPAAAPVSPAVV